MKTQIAEREQTAQRTSTFNAALPYGAATLAIGTIGAITAVAAASTIVKILGIAMGIIGAYGFLATMICGFMYMGDPKGFEENWNKYAVTAIGSAVSNIITKVIHEVISNLLDKAFGRQTVSVRRVEI